MALYAHFVELAFWPAQRHHLFGGILTGLFQRFRTVSRAVAKQNVHIFTAQMNMAVGHAHRNIQRDRRGSRRCRFFTGGKFLQNLLGNPLGLLFGVIHNGFLT